MCNIAQRSALLAFLVAIPACLGGDDETPPPNSAVVSFFEATSFPLELDSTAGVTLVLTSSDGKALTSDVSVLITDTTELGDGFATSELDYNFDSLPLQAIFPAGSRSGNAITFSLGTILADDLEDDQESIKLGLSIGDGDVEIGAISSHTMHISESAGMVAFQKSASEAEEGRNDFPIFLQLSTVHGEVLTEEINVTVDISDSGSATLGDDFTFTSVDLNFPVNSLDGDTRTFLVSSLLIDLLDEGSETVVFEITEVTGDASKIGSPNQHTLNIFDREIHAVDSPGAWNFEGEAELLQWVGIHPLGSDEMLLVGSQAEGFRHPAAAKLEATGELAWVKTIDVDMNVDDSAYQPNTGAHILAGNRTTEIFMSDGAAMAFDQNGGVSWMNQYQFATELENASHYFLGASAAGNDAFFVGAMTSKVLRESDLNTDTFGLITKVDSSGAAQWSMVRGYVPSGITYELRGVATTTSNDALAVGYSTHTNPNNADGWLVGIHSSGIIANVSDLFYEANSQNPGNDYFDRIAPLSGNQFLILGRSHAFFNPTHRRDAWILRVDAQGIPVSQRVFAGPRGTELIFEDCLEMNGFYYLAGALHYLDGFTPSESILVRLDPSTLVADWAYTFPGTVSNSLLSLAARSDGDFVLSGALFDDSTSWQGWILRTDEMGLAGSHCNGDIHASITLESISLSNPPSPSPEPDYYLNGEHPLLSGPQTTPLSPVSAPRTWPLDECCP